VTPTAAKTAPTSRAGRRAVGGRVAALFDEHAAMVLGLCRLLLRDHHEAEDAAQQTFVSAYRALLRGTEPREPGPWLAAIARNECRARLRKRMRAPVALDGDIELELSDTSDDLAELADRRAELGQLAVEIAKLPSRQREAIALRDFLGLSYEEVASTLKVSVPVVESLLFRARRRLRDTVRTVPRYAAGIVMVPFAMRAALARELPDFDAVTAGLGIAGAAGAAAGGVAKLVSLPASAKIAATVAVVVTGSVMAPKLIHAPSEEHAAARAAAVAAIQGERQKAVENAPAAAVGPDRPPVADSAPDQSGAEQASAPAAAAAAEAAPGAAASAAQHPAAGEAEADPVRISSGVKGGDPIVVPPLPPPAVSVAPAACEGPVAPDEQDGATPESDPAADPCADSGGDDSGAGAADDVSTPEAAATGHSEGATPPEAPTLSWYAPGTATDPTGEPDSGADGGATGADPTDAPPPPPPPAAS
jgi:RNA polymerase sigma factor (sigma-70 family)